MYWSGSSTYYDPLNSTCVLLLNSISKPAYHILKGSLNLIVCIKSAGVALKNAFKDIFAWTPKKISKLNVFSDIQIYFFAHNMLRTTFIPIS